MTTTRSEQVYQFILRNQGLPRHKIFSPLGIGSNDLEGALLVIDRDTDKYLWEDDAGRLFAGEEEAQRQEEYHKILDKFKS